MAYKTKRKGPVGGQRKYSRPKMILKTENTRITGKKTILYSDIIRREILQNEEIINAIVDALNDANIIEEVFDKAGYIPIVSAEKITKKTPGPKRNFKSEEDRQKAREHIIERHQQNLDAVEAEAGFLENAKGKKRQDRKKVKGVPLVQWDIAVSENAGRKTVVIFTNDQGVSYQEVELGKIAPKMRRRSKRNKMPEDGV